MSTLGKEYAILLKTKTKTKTETIKTMKQKRENGGGAMKLYFTYDIASIGVCETHTAISMNIGGKIVSISIPNNDLKIHELSDDFREGDTLADWLARNGKEV